MMLNLRSLLSRRKQREIPIGIFSHHKVATVLTISVFKEICAARKWEFTTRLGRQSVFPEDKDVVLFGHSLIDISTPFLGVHFIRDPRDVIVSGYNYHRRTDEKWCVNEKFDFTSPISPPQIPHILTHKSEEFKNSYLASLNNKSYQKTLHDLSLRDGLLFEINNYGSWTIEGMSDWNYQRSNILEVKFEDLMSDYDESFIKIFQHFQFSNSEIEQALAIASRHDIGRKSKTEIEKMDHVSSRKTSQWHDFFEAEHKQAFVQKFGDVLVKLGYEDNNDWASQ